MSTSCRITIGGTDGGYLIGIHGHGTCLQSPGFEMLVDKCLGDESLSAIIDLSACEFLDSTFLGCLVTLHQRYNSPDHDRLKFSASSEDRSRLLHLSKLDHLLEFVTTPTASANATVETDVTLHDRHELGRHIAESHRRLAELGGPEAAKFEQIARNISEELDHE